MTSKSITKTPERKLIFSEFHCLHVKTKNNNIKGTLIQILKSKDLKLKSKDNTT